VEGRHQLEMFRLIRIARPQAVAAPKNLTPEQEAEWAKNNDFKAMPTDKRLGPLSGKYLPSRMADDFNEMARVPTDLQRLWFNMLSTWKWGKTVANLPTHGHNIISNAVVFSYLDGNSPMNPQNWGNFAAAAKELVSKNSADWRYLAENNLINVGGRVGMEMQGILDPRMSSFDQYTTNKIKKLARGGVKVASDIYAAEDDLFKLASFKKRLNEGMSREEAIQSVRESYPDPARASKIAKIMRNVPFGSPFVTFTDQAIRVGFRQARRHPIRLGTVAMLPVLLNEISRAYLGLDDEDEEKLLGERSWTEPLLPMRDRDGKLQTLDMRYLLPLANDLIPAQKNGTLSVPFVWSNPALVAMAEQIYGIDKFTGRRFVDDEMTPVENVKARVGQATKTLNPLPSMLTYGISDVEGAADGTNEKILSHAILNQVTGVNIRTPYIRERHVRTLLKNMIEEGEVEQAHSLVETWNKSYKPGNLENLKLRDIARGTRSTNRRRYNEALEKASRAFIRGDDATAKETIKKYNEDRQDGTPEITIEQAREVAPNFRDRGFTR